MSKDHPITVDVNEKTCKIYCDDHHGLRRDTFAWNCHHGSLVIEFNKNDTPFENGEWRFTALVHDRTQPLAKVRQDANFTAYKYSVKVTLPTGKDCKLDPQVIIDEVLDPADTKVLSEAVGDALQNVVDRLVRAVKEVGATTTAADRLFFPHGIELISIDVEVGPAKVIVKVAGPKPGGDGADQLE